MRRNLALFGDEPTRRQARPVSCLACVVLISAAFWTGAVWIAEILIHMGRTGY